MTAEASHHQLVSVEDYLVTELKTDTKHEYLGGVVYAMAGGGNRHNRISGNIFGTLFGSLSGKPCQPYNSDTKVRVRRLEDTRFYYPDVQIVCRSNSLEEQFQDEPTVIFEVLSESTRRIDEQEKRSAYCSVPSLHAYVLVEQDRALVIVWRRTGHGFVREEHTGFESTILFPELEIRLLLRDVYEGVLTQ
jgi:Uma2 family endonuclease